MSFDLLKDPSLSLRSYPPHKGEGKASRCLFLAFFLLLSIAGHVFAAELPALTGRVVDAANVIEPDTRAAITRQLEAFEKKSSDQVVVVTVPDLDGEDIESYSNRLYRHWALGQKQENNGVLLVVAPNDRKVRIEVGYGLEGTLTDLLSKLIIENSIIPGFRSGDYSGGISRGVGDIIQVLSGDTAELEARAKRNIKEPNTDIDWFMVIFITIWATIFFGGFGMAVLAPVFGQKIGPGQYRWLGMNIDTRPSKRSGGSKGGWSSGGGGWSSGGGGGGFSGGGGSSGGGGASGSW